MLLPRLEQAALFNSVNFAAHVQADSNETCRLEVLDVFLCPSDHAPRVVPFFRRSGDGEDGGRAAGYADAGRGGVLFEVAGASYVGVFGDHDPDDRPDVHGDGLFELNSRVRFADIVDGTSHTLAVGERSALRLASTWTGMHPGEEEGPERVVGFAQRGPNHPLADEAEFSSRHPAGVHFLFGDGSVRAVGDTVDEVIYRSLATRAGQETVASQGF
jgi:prepilin-type processing-associated H-X9-DG protein